MFSTKIRFRLAILLIFAFLIPFPKRCRSETVIVNFDGLTGTTTLPPTFASSTTPSFEFSHVFGPVGTTQIDNINHGGTGPDFELRIFWGAGAASVISIQESEGQIFSFDSFDYEAQSGSLSQFTVRSFRKGVLVGQRNIFSIGTHEFTSDPSFQDIDELSIIIGIQSSQTLLDNFSFNSNDVVLLGDVNLDGVVNLLDVNEFVDRIGSGAFQSEADCNQDGVVNLLDVAFFIAILSGG